MLAKTSTFLGPSSFFRGTGGTPSLVLSLNAFGFSGSNTWFDSSKLNNDGHTDGYISYSNEVGGSFNFDGTSSYFFFERQTYNIDEGLSYGVFAASNFITSIVPGDWSTKQAVSQESYTGKIKLTFQRGVNPGGIICGFTEDPNVPGNNYNKLKYGFYLQTPSVLSVVEGNDFNVNLTYGTYSEANVYSIVYDGKTVKYYVDGNEFYKSSTTPSNPLYLYATFNGNDLGVVNVEFGPYVEAIPLETSEYTVEAWFKSNSYSGSEQGPLISWGSLYSPNYSNVLRLNDNGFIHYWWANDIYATFTGTQSMITDNWYYVASTYDGTYRKIYLNGIQVALDTPLTPPSVNDMTTLRVGYDGLNYFDGKISKAKITTKALAAGTILSNFNSDKIRHGYEFGSMVLGGTSSFALSTSAGSKGSYVFGSNDYTLEGFFKCATYSDYSGIVGTRNYTGETGIAINLTNTGLIRFLVEGSYHDSATISTNKWYHVALSRVSGTTSCYINGEYTWEFTDITSYSGEYVVIGKYYTNEDQGFYFNGIISNVRLINGVGLYSGTASFEIPTTQLQATNETELLIISQKTSPAVDVSGKLHVVTNNSIGWTSSLPIFQITEFEYLNFSTTAGLATYGDEVTVISNYLYLTPATNNRTGNVYTNTATNYNRDFTLTWNFECGNGDGADGFCVQWTSVNNTFGLGGGGVGRISGSGTIAAISFQTYNGNLIYTQTGTDVAVFNFTNAFRQNLYYWLYYNHAASTIEIFWSSTNTKPGGSPNVTLTSVVFDSNNYYFGFGAATGALNDEHILKSMKMVFDI